MALKCLGGVLRTVVPQHIAGAGAAQLAYKPVAQLLLRARLEHAQYRQRHGNAHVAVPDGIGRHGHGDVGTRLAAPIAGGEGGLAAVLLQELLGRLQLGVVHCLGARARRQQMRQVVILRNAGAVHQHIHKHGNERPAVGPVVHQLQVHILRSAEGVQHQQLVGRQRQQHHGHHHGHQAGRQRRDQPGGPELIRRAVEVHLVHHADHGIGRVHHLLGRAGGAAGVGAEQRPVFILGHGGQLLHSVSQRQKIVPSENRRAFGTARRIALVQRLADVGPQRVVIAGGAGVHQHHALHLPGGQIGVHLPHGEKIVGENHRSAGLLHRLHIFPQGVVPADQRRTHLFRGQQQIQKLRNRLQEHRDPVALADAQRVQGLSHLIRLFQQFVPGNVASVVVHRRNRPAGHILLQIGTQGAVGHLHSLHHLGRVILHPGPFLAGKAALHRLIHLFSPFGFWQNSAFFVLGAAGKFIPPSAARCAAGALGTCPGK